jgi:TgpA N-terminal domain/Transglutaminase-like superfamily
MMPQQVTARDRVTVAMSPLVPTREHLVDAAVAAVMVLLALVGFRTSFFGWSWLLAGAAGLVLGLLAAHVVASYRLPAVVTVAVVAAAYFLLGGALAVRDDLIAGFIPSLTTFSVLADTLVGGWKVLLTTLPPVDSRGPLLALPFLVCLVGAAATYAVARRWRSAYLALGTPLALLVLSIAMGTVTPAAAILQGVLFGLVAIGWAALRANRNRAPLQNGAARTTRAVTAFALLLVAALGGWLVGPRLPGGDDTARTVWRTDLQPPFDVTQYPSPLAGFRKFTEPNPATLFDKTLLTVKGLPKGTPVRIASLDTYDGSVWGAGNAANNGTDAGGSSFRRVGTHIDASGPGRAVTAVVSIPAGGYSEVWLPTAGTVTGIEFIGSRERALADSLRFNIDTDTAILPERLQAGDSYRLTAIIAEQPATLPTQISAGSESLVDTQALTFVDAKVDSWAGNSQGQWQQLLAVARYMRSEGAYTDGGSPGTFQNVYLPGHSLGRLNRFVKSDQLAGDDEQYAATLALMANRLGLPARIVLGAIPDDAGTIKGKDVRAWVEVKTDTASWVPILPAEFVPDRNKVPNQQQLKSEEKKTGAQVPPPAANNPPSVLQGPDQAQNATQRPAAKRSFLDPRSWPDWVLTLLKLVVLPILVLLAAYGLLRAVKSRRRRRRRTTGPMSARISGGWAELVDTARDLGVVAPPRATRLEQAAALESWHGDLLPLAARANGHVFGPVEPTQDEIDGYWAQVDQVRHSMRRRAGFWRRLRSDVNLRSFARVAGEPRPGQRRGLRPGPGPGLGTAVRRALGRRPALGRATDQ